MKRTNLVLAAILILILIFCIILTAGSRLKTEISYVSAASSEHPETYITILDILENGIAPQQFTNVIPDSDAGISLLSISVTATNPGLLDAEWLQLSVEPASGDIAVYSVSGTDTDIAAGESSTSTVKLITRTPDEKRKIHLTYYILGKQKSITINA